MHIVAYTVSLRSSGHRCGSHEAPLLIQEGRRFAPGVVTSPISGVEEHEPLGMLTTHRLAPLSSRILA